MGKIHVLHSKPMKWDFVPGGLRHKAPREKHKWEFCERKIKTLMLSPSLWS